MSDAKRALDLQRFFRLLEKFRMLDSDISVLTVEAIVQIGKAQRDGIHQRTLQKELGVTRATASRIAARLGPDGLRLVRSVPDPQNRSTHLLFLTPDGERVIREVLDFMNGES